ncbi:hypothetical protein J6590_036977 [Homalodisca vitripennis]|nr:hypothetical protein J6590_036977 [Homalodisca vitripennis]
MRPEVDLRLSFGRSSLLFERQSTCSLTLGVWYAYAYRNSLAYVTIDIEIDKRVRNTFIDQG